MESSAAFLLLDIAGAKRSLEGARAPYKSERQAQLQSNKQRDIRVCRQDQVSFPMCLYRIWQSLCWLCKKLHVPRCETLCKLCLVLTSCPSFQGLGLDDDHEADPKLLDQLRALHDSNVVLKSELLRERAAREQVEWKYHALIELVR